MLNIKKILSILNFFELDSNQDIQPNTSPLFTYDINGDIMWIEGGIRDLVFELDINGDINLKG